MTHSIEVPCPHPDIILGGSQTMHHRTAGKVDCIIRPFGLSGVSALPLDVAVERSVHYFWDFFLFFSSLPHTFLPEGVCPMIMKFYTEF